MRTRRIFQTTRTKNINETAEGRKKKKKKRITGIQEGIKKEDVLRDERRLCRHLYIFVIPLSCKGWSRLFVICINTLLSWSCLSLKEASTFCVFYDMRDWSFVYRRGHQWRHKHSFCGRRLERAKHEGNSAKGGIEHAERKTFTNRSVRTGQQRPFSG